MYDMAISWGCDRLGVMFMTDNVSAKMQNIINNKADEIFQNAQEEFVKFLTANGYEYRMGVIRSNKFTYPECFGKPITDNGRAENGCEGCQFEMRCDIARKEMTV